MKAKEFSQEIHFSLKHSLLFVKNVHVEMTNNTNIIVENNSHKLLGIIYSKNNKVHAVAKDIDTIIYNLNHIDADTIDTIAQMFIEYTFNYRVERIG